MIEEVGVFVAGGDDGEGECLVLRGVAVIYRGGEGRDEGCWGKEEEEGEYVEAEKLHGVGCERVCIGYVS